MYENQSPARIHLFDAFQLVRPDGERLPLRSQKLTGLLAYLTLHAGQLIERDALARRLWPHSSSTAARRNLREYLYRARQVLAEFLPRERMLSADERGVMLTLPDSNACWVDVHAFEFHLTQAEQSLDPAQRIEHWQAARALYQGDLLASFYDDWVIGERKRLRELYVHCLERLADEQWRLGRVADALETARLAVTFDPYHEAFWRRVIEWSYLSGDRAQAMQQYRAYEAWLKEELDATPDADMAALGRRILEEASVAPEPSSPVAPLTSVSALAFTPPFVGRQPEIIRLNLALDERPQSPIDTIIIVGASGVGKTRLVEEWRQSLEGKAIVMDGRAHEFEQGIPYRPVLDAVQAVLPLAPWRLLPPAATHAWLAPLAQFLPDLYFHLPDLPAQPALADNETAHHVMEGLAQIMLALVRQAPLALLLDDLHWADLSTWSFLPFISRRMRHTRFLIVCTFSSTDATADARSRLRALQRGSNVQTISLSLLWPADMANLLPSELRDAVDSVETFSSRLHQLTNGNPFFATEILRALLESDLPRPYTASSLDQLRLPDAVQTLIQTRLDRLSPESYHALSMAAAVRREFSVDLLRRITGFEENALLGFLDEWLRRGLVVEKGGAGYDFSHQQIREVAYHSLSRSRRRRLHRQVAMALEQEKPTDVERVTRHYSLSDRPDLAIPGLLEAGQRALNLRSYREAQAIGRTLLDILQRMPEAAGAHDRLALNIQLALAYGFRGETGRALALLEEAAALAEQLDDAQAAAETLLRIAQIHWLRGDVRRCRPYAERCLALTRDRRAFESRDVEAAVLRLLGRLNIAQGRYAEAAPCLEEALSILGQAPEHRLNRVTTQGYLITAYGRMGREADVRELMLELDKVTRGLDSPALRGVIAVQTGVAFNALNCWEEARQWAEEGLRLCQEHDLPVYVFVAKTVLGRTAYYQEGDVRRAYALLREAIAWAVKHDYWLFRFMAYIFLAEIALAEQDADTLAEQVAAVQELAARTDNAWALKMVEGYWAAALRESRS
ncbi:MAG: AAA family ATPase [Chloroflexi bacterium]|nr:AAA family ATPase [Chloroflexota bacterium]